MMRTKTRLLVLTPSYPFPPSDGVRLRLTNLLQRLPASWSLDLVAFDSVPEVLEQPLPEPLRGTALRVPYPASPRGLLATPLAQIARSEAALLWKFRSPAMATMVAERAANADAVLAVGLQMGQYLRQVPARTPTALDNYNVESRILSRMAATRPGPKRAYWLVEAAKLRRAERRVLRRAGTVFAISDVDRAVMQAMAPRARVRTVPMGIDLGYFHPAEDTPASPAACFTFAGVFNWHVNEDAATWLCLDVWPRILRALPDAQLHLVGRDPSDAVRKLAQDPSVHVSGTVPDVRPYLWRSTALLVPLRYGSGVRTKILEGFAAGRPVVSTTVGCEGLPVHPGEDILVADSAEEFAGACVRLWQEPDASARLVAAAGALVREHDRQATLLLHQALAEAFGFGDLPKR